MKISEDIIAALISVIGCFIIVGGYLAFYNCPEFWNLYMPQIIGGLIAGGMTIVAGWLAFCEARNNNRILRHEIRQKNLYVIVNQTHILYKNICKICEKSTQIRARLSELNIEATEDISASTMAELRELFVDYREIIIQCNQDISENVVSIGPSELPRYTEFLDCFFSTTKAFDFLGEDTSKREEFIKKFFCTKLRSPVATNGMFEETIRAAQIESAALLARYTAELMAVSKDFLDGQS